MVRCANKGNSRPTRSTVWLQMEGERRDVRWKLRPFVGFWRRPSAPLSAFRSSSCSGLAASPSGFDRT